MDKDEKELWKDYNTYIKKIKFELIYKLILCIILLVCGILSNIKFFTILAILGGIGSVIVLVSLIYVCVDPTSVYSFHTFKRNTMMKDLKNKKDTIDISND